MDYMDDMDGFSWWTKWTSWTYEGNRDAQRSGRRGVKIQADEALSAECRRGIVTIRFKSGQELSFPIAGNPRLESGTEEELNDIELSPFGIHWPRLDEDLSFEGIVAGDYGQQRSE